jgi:ribulose-5-phosphate 4-epimerase/fuculose-1-phosphate aldolase
MDEGYIKFNCKRITSDDIPLDKVADLNVWRKIIYDKGMIGMYPDGIGFGNISIRHKDNSFLISGTATGGIPNLDALHYALVTDFDLSSNSLICKGQINASSESLTHALIYECSPSTNAVIHIHNLEIWKRLMNKVPTSNEQVPYGTPEMAKEIKRLFIETDLNREKIIVMAGHEEGIISFGKNLEEAANVLLGNLE